MSLTPEPAGVAQGPLFPVGRLDGATRRGPPQERCPTELAAWWAKTAAAGSRCLSDLPLAMVRTRTCTAPAADVGRERTRQVVRIGNNLSQLARWANAIALAVEAVEVIAYFVAFERELRKLARIGQDGGDAHQVPPARHRLGPALRPTTSSAARHEGP